MRLPHTRRLSALDGLRAFAVALVVLDHSLSGFEGGGVGVCVFFVLSGFLITTLLMREQERGAISRGRFYARRALRLYPALLVMLVATVALGCSAKYAALAATYTTDLYNTFTGHSAGPYGHTWSLALEEQFYLLWPLALPLVLRRRRIAAWALALAAVASFVTCWIGTQSMIGHGGITSAVFDPLWQAHGLLIGCLLALVVREHRIAVATASRLIVAGTVATVGVAVLASITVSRGWASGWNVLAELAAAAVIAGMVNGGGVRVYESRVAVWVGERSYGIYLWHMPLIYLAARYGVGPGNISRLSGAAIVGVPAAVAAAAVSYRWVETPFLVLKDRMHAPATTKQPTASSIAGTASPLQLQEGRAL